MAHDQSLEYLYTALGSPIGIVLRVSDFGLASQKLYSARRKSGDPDLAFLQFRRSPVEPEQELWIVKGSAPINEKET